MISYEQNAYERAELIITEFDSANVITTSNETNYDLEPYEGNPLIG